MTPPGPENDTVRIRLAPGRLRPAGPQAPAAAAPAPLPQAATPQLPPPAARPRRRVPAWAIAGVAALLLGFGLGSWLFWPHPATSPPAPPQALAPQALAPQAAAPAAPVAPPPAPTQAATAPLAAPQAPSPQAPPAATPPAAVPAFIIRTADRRQILADVPDHLTVFRFAANPRIVVLDFPSLRMQGLMLDRVAALIEKAGLPRDRVVSEAELLAAIHAHGDTVSTYYYGHDYSAADLARFFALAKRDHVTLNPQEQRLHALMSQLGWFAPGVQAGLITLPRLGANPYVTQEARSVILSHELSHGEFFSDPAYAAYVRHFWARTLTASERAGMRQFLGKEEYDTADRTLMLNEMQAYVMFTRDPVFFRAADIGISDARRTQLQREFLAGMPPGWLKDRLARLNAGR